MAIALVPGIAVIALSGFQVQARGGTARGGGPLRDGAMGAGAHAHRLVEDVRIPIDIRLVERGMRRVAVGRKNHYGSRSEPGTRVAALFYTRIESAKLADVEPAGHRAQATRRATDTPGTITLPSALAAR